MKNIFFTIFAEDWCTYRPQVYKSYKQGHFCFSRLNLNITTSSNGRAEICKFYMLDDFCFCHVIGNIDTSTANKFIDLIQIHT